MPLSTLASWYHNSVGSNAHLELDFAIDRTGNIAPAHAAAYSQFGAWIRSCYGNPLATGAIPAGSNSVTIDLPLSAVDRVSMVEGMCVAACQESTAGTRIFVIPVLGGAPWEGV